MGKGFCTASAGAKAVFEEANEALGFNLARLMFEGPEAALTLTTNPQPAVLTASVAAAAACAERGLEPTLAAGHSLGEYSALVVARALRFADAVRIVRKRGALMQDAVPVGTASDRKSTRLNSSHGYISYAVFCLKKKKNKHT